MSITCSQLLDSLPELLNYVSGNKEVFINNVSPAEKGAKDSILFIASEKHFIKAVQSPASVLVVPDSHKDKAKAFAGSKTLLSSTNPPLAMARVLDQFFNPKIKAQGIHPTAVVAPSAVIARSAYVGPYAIIGSNVTVGNNTQISSHVVIEDGVTIGSNTVIMPYVFVGSHCKVGNFCELKPHSTIGSEGFGFAHDAKGNHHRIPQIGIVVIEDHVSIGAQCTIDKATFEETKVGRGTKIDNMVHIAHNCKVGENCLFAGQAGIAGSVTIGNNVVLGGGTSVAGHQRVCDNVQVGGRSAFQGGIDKPGAYSGFPLEPVRDYLRTQTSIKRLTGTIKDVKKILKHLGLESSEPKNDTTNDRGGSE